eukprot:5801197-Pyramimonas_sp.AAC.1
MGPAGPEGGAVSTFSHPPSEMGPVRPDANRDVSSPSLFFDDRPGRGPPQRPAATTDGRPKNPATVEMGPVRFEGNAVSILSNLP